MPEASDHELQESLRSSHPDCYERCIARREFMRSTLGIEVPDDVLPSSNIPTTVPPFFLAPNRVFAVER